MNNFFFVTPIVTVCMATLGWYIVNKQTNYRERRKEIFDLHKRILDTIIEMDVLLTKSQEDAADNNLKILRVQVFALQKYIENIIELYLNCFKPSNAISCEKKMRIFFDKIEDTLNTNICKKSQQKHNVVGDYKQSFYYLQSEIQEQILSHKIILDPDWAEKILHKITFGCKYLKNYLIQKFRKLMKNIFG